MDACWLDGWRNGGAGCGGERTLRAAGHAQPAFACLPARDGV